MPDPFQPRVPDPHEYFFLPSERTEPAPTIWEPTPQQIAHVSAVYHRMERWPRLRVENTSYEIWTEVFINQVPRADVPCLVLGELTKKLYLRWETEWIVEDLIKRGAVADPGDQLDVAVVEAVQNQAFPWKFGVWAGRLTRHPRAKPGLRAITFSQIYCMRAPAVDPDWEDVVRLLGLL